MVMDKTGKAKDGGKAPLGQNLQEGSDQTSTAEQLTSSIEEGKAYAGDVVKKLVLDALSADGREQKSRAEAAEASLRVITDEHQNLKTQFNTVSSQVSELLRAKMDAEADAVKDDPVALGSLRVRQSNTAERLRLEGYDAQVKSRETKFNEEKASFAKKEASLNIKLSAMAAGIDEKTLADLVPDGNAERLARAAAILKQSGSKPAETEPGKAKPAGLTNKPASVLSSGGDSKSVSEKMLENAKGKK